LREEVERLKQILKIKGFSDSKDEIKEKLTESENLMEEFTMSWEEKEKNTEKIKQVPLVYSNINFPSTISIYNTREMPQKS
jgi:hypothetical protein